MLLLNWAARTGAWIIEDDYDSEYRFGGRPIASLQGLDTDARVIYVGTFSKVMFPALRLGYVVVPKDLVDAFADARDATDQFSSTLYQAVMTDFIREGHLARHIRRMRMLYMERRTALVEAIRKQMDGQLEVIGARSGNASGGAVAAGRERRGSCEKSREDRNFGDAVLFLLHETARPRRLDPRLRRRGCAANSRRHEQAAHLHLNSPRGAADSTCRRTHT